MSRNTEATDDVKTWTGGPLNYKEGFFTQLATDELAKGINEEVVRAISAKRNEPGGCWSFVSTPITHGWRWKNRTG